MTRTLTLPFLLLSLAACGDKTEDSGADGTDGSDGEDCSAIAIASVFVTLEAADGALDDGSAATVEYSVDGGDFSDCVLNPGTLNYSCGYEEPGSFVVRASADGYVPAEATAEVESDECHVITESVTLVLEPEVSAGG